MKFSKIVAASFIFFALFSSSLFALGKKDASETETSSQSEEIKKEKLSISLFLDTKKVNSKNHLNWKTSSQKYKDSFDSISGASKLHSTKLLREATLDASSKSLQIPKGLRALCLFSVSSFEMLQKDDFSITHENEKMIIQFSHRGTDYKIESDEKGVISVPDGFFIRMSQKANSETETEETESQFIADKPNMKILFLGKLTAQLTKDGIFTLKGTLQLGQEIESQKTELSTTEENENQTENENSSQEQIN